MNEGGEFLQSENWLKFQEAVGRETLQFAEGKFSANGIVHKLPLVGAYLYVPRGPLYSFPAAADKRGFFSGRLTYKQELEIKHGTRALFRKAQEKRLGWIRVEPATEAMLTVIQKAVGVNIMKAPYDTQPCEVLIVDLSPGEEALLAAMKPKTRYNINLAQKRGLHIFTTEDKKYKEAFCNLIGETARRKKITPHPRAYYEKMFKVLPEDTRKLFVAEYEGEILAANLLVIFGQSAIYLHGGSASARRDLMAPYLLQWEQMKFAKTRGCLLYDFGGIKTADCESSDADYSWAGITRFKRGFSPRTAPLVFPGAYDIILNPQMYLLYRHLHDLKKTLGRFKKFVNR